MLHLNGITIDPVRRTIGHNGTVVGFQSRSSPHSLPGHSLLFDLACRLIIGPPATHGELWDTLYQHDVHGGPNYGNKVVEVHLQHLKPKLARLKLRVHRISTSKTGFYFEKWIAP